MENIQKIIDLIPANYENFILKGKVNTTEFETSKKKKINKSDICSFENLMLEATCCKSVHKSKCIELTMANRSRSF